MPQCPYPPTILDEESEIEIPNIKYIAWYEGYDACKLEIADAAIILASIIHAYQDEIAKIQKLESELQAKRR
jgi:hypothetical protein